VVENRKIKPYFCLWLDSIVYSSPLYKSRKNLAPRADYYAMFIASRYGSIWYQEIWFVSEVLCYFTHFHCDTIKSSAIEKLFMNKPGDFMDKFRVPIIGRYIIDGDWYAVFDVEDILYSVGLVNYKDNNEGSIYKVIRPYAVFSEKLDKRAPRKLNDILDSSM
jgi:hypothetical protein